LKRKVAESHSQTPAGKGFRWTNKKKKQKEERRGKEVLSTQTKVLKTAELEPTVLKT